MPYVPDHPVFHLPVSEVQTIWRYMDLPKFVALLNDKVLYLSRADLLGDPFEGSTTKGVAAKRTAQLTAEGVPEFAKAMSSAQELTRSYTYANCWHISSHESAAMWSQYVNRGLGVAVQSTIPRLTNALSTGLADDPANVYVGAVKYIDYDTDWIPDGNVLWPYVHKRKSFEFERELRVVTMRLSDYMNVMNEIDKEEAEGFRAPIDLESLIEQVYASPTSKKWFRDVVQATAQKFGLTLTVRQSSLDNGPVF